MTNEEQIIAACDPTQASDPIERATTIIQRDLQLALTKISKYEHKGVGRLTWDVLVTNQLCYALSVHLALLLSSGVDRESVNKLMERIPKDVRFFEGTGDE